MQMLSKIFDKAFKEKRYLSKKRILVLQVFL